MSRYIDADLLLAKCRRNPLFEKCEKDKGMVYIERSIIDDTPTADVVEVVRCKDCKHYKVRDGVHYGTRTIKSCCRSANKKVSENDYCSYGERSKT